MREGEPGFPDFIVAIVIDNRRVESVRLLAQWAEDDDPYIRECAVDALSEFRESHVETVPGTRSIEGRRKLSRFVRIRSL